LILSFDSRTSAQRNHRAVKSTDRSVTGDISAVVSSHADGPAFRNFRFILLVALGVRCIKGRESRATSFSSPSPFISFSPRAERVHSFGVLEFPLAIERYDLDLSSLVAVETLSLSLSLSLSLPSFFPLFLSVKSFSRNLVSLSCEDNNRPYVASWHQTYQTPPRFSSSHLADARWKRWMPFSSFRSSFREPLLEPRSPLQRKMLLIETPIATNYRHLEAANIVAQDALPTPSTNSGTIRRYSHRV